VDRTKTYIANRQGMRTLYTARLPLPGPGSVLSRALLSDSILTHYSQVRLVHDYSTP